jgi:hypothetical protein
VGRSISIAHFVQRKRRAVDVTWPAREDTGCGEPDAKARTDALSFAHSPMTIVPGTAVSGPVATDDSVQHDD